MTLQVGLKLTTFLVLAPWINSLEGKHYCKRQTNFKKMKVDKSFQISDKHSHLLLERIFLLIWLTLLFPLEWRSGNNFQFTYRIPKDLISGVAYKFQCGPCNEFYYGECMRQLNVKLVNMLVYHHLAENTLHLSSVTDHLIFCNHSASYDDYSILTCDYYSIFPWTEREPVNPF